MENLEKNNNAGNGFATTIVSANKKGTHSTVIPKPILNKFGLAKGQVLNWDIKDNDIVITPIGNNLKSFELLNMSILKDILTNGNSSKYTNAYEGIVNILSKSKDKITNDGKLDELKADYESYTTNETQESYKQIVSYLLLSDLPKDHHEILIKFNEWLQAQ